MDIKEFAKQNKWIIALFAVSTAYFVLVHFLSISWDFSTYVLNAKYWFANGTYFEPLRPPLVPVALGLLSVFSWKAAEVLFIVLVSAFFAYTSARIANALGIKKEYWYAIALSPYFLQYGFMAGTELIALAFIQLAVACVLEKKDSGVWLGLAALCRYNFAVFLPIVLFHRKITDIIKNALLFAVPFIPWFAYNYFAYGNIFASIADNYALNVLMRGYLMQPANAWHILAVAGIALPFIVAGLAITGCTIAKRKAKIQDWLMLLLALLALYSYLSPPLKDARYLFALIIPFTYFAIIGIQAFSNLFKKRGKITTKTVFIVAALGFLFCFASLPARSVNFEQTTVYKQGIAKLQKLGLDNCAVQSNAWIFMEYLGRPTEVFPPAGLVEKALSQNKSIIFLNRLPEPEYTQNKTIMHSFPVISETKEYIIIGNKTSCAPITKTDELYIIRTARNVLFEYNETIETNPCKILFKTKIIQEICKLANKK